MQDDNQCRIYGGMGGVIGYACLRRGWYEGALKLMKNKISHEHKICIIIKYFRVKKIGIIRSFFI